MNLKEFAFNFKYAFRPTKPKLFFRLIWALIRSFLFGRPPLRYVDFAINFNCNLKCEHCFATILEDSKRRKMTIEDYRNVTKECMKLGAVNFSFQGGEPLLSKDIGDIIKACKPSKNVISVTTNGTLLDKERIDELKKMGVDILTVSLDSGFAEEHDRFRGVNGTFDKAISGIELALNSGFKVTLGTVVTHNTLRSDGIKRLVDIAGRLKVLLYFIFPVPAGRWIENTDMFLTDEDLNYIEELKKEIPYLRTDFQANLGPYGCGAVKEILYLTPYGDVLACPFLHISLGNIFEESIEDIRKRSLKNPYFKVYHQKCLASTDKEFIERYLSKTFNSDRLLHWSRVFECDEKE